LKIAYPARTLAPTGGVCYAPLHMELVLKVLPWAQIVLSVLLIGAILLQRSGSEVGGALGGGDSGTASMFHTKRGMEKTLFNATILIALLFAVSAFVALVIK